MACSAAGQAQLGALSSCVSRRDTVAVPHGGQLGLRDEPGVPRALAGACAWLAVTAAKRSSQVCCVCCAQSFAPRPRDVINAMAADKASHCSATCPGVTQGPRNFGESLSCCPAPGCLLLSMQSTHAAGPTDVSLAEPMGRRCPDTSAGKKDPVAPEVRRQGLHSACDGWLPAAQQALEPSAVRCVCGLATSWTGCWNGSVEQCRLPLLCPYLSYTLAVASTTVRRSHKRVLFHCKARLLSLPSVQTQRRSFVL